MAVMRRIYFIFLFVVMLALSEGILHGSTWAIVQGTVKSKDGKPIEGAIVILQNADGAKYEYLTDKNGKWIAANIEPGDWKLVVGADGYQPQTMSASFSSVRRNEPLNIKLEPVPKSPVAKADSLYNEGKYKEAIDEYKKVLSQNPDMLQIYEKIGIAYYKMKDLDNAINTLKELLEKKPDSKNAIFNLSAIYIEKNNLEEALKYFKMIDEASISDPDLFYNFGLLSFKNDKIDEAISFFEKCILRDDKYYEAYYQLGLAYTNKGDLEKAKINFQKVIEIKPDSEEAAFAKSMLESM
jgi:tetratricopeptide (TPR) repeat protein